MTRLTEKIRYVVECIDNPVQLRWISNLGGFESYVFKLVSKTKQRADIVTRLDFSQRNTEIVRKRNNEVWRVIAENVTQKTAEGIATILQSNFVYYCPDQNKAIPVNISGNTLEFFKVSDNLQTVAFTFTTRYLGGV